MSQAPSDSGTLFRPTGFGNQSAECVMSNNCKWSDDLNWLRNRKNIYFVVVWTRGNSCEIGNVIWYSADTHYWVCSQWPGLCSQSWLAQWEGLRVQTYQTEKRTTFNNNFPLNDGPCMDAVAPTHCPLISGRVKKNRSKRVETWIRTSLIAACVSYLLTIVWTHEYKYIFSWYVSDSRRVESGHGTVASDFQQIQFHCSANNVVNSFGKLSHSNIVCCYSFHNFAISIRFGEVKTKILEKTTNDIFLSYFFDAKW